MRLDFNNRVLLMGILNVTPDSFYDGGKYADLHQAIDRAYAIAEEGADIVDIGGESTRPGSVPLSEQEEIDRVCPLIEAIAGKISIPISIDTYKSKVAAVAIQAGAAIINDISGFSFDERMVETASMYDCPVIASHIKGTPRDMQKNPVYENLVGEIGDFLDRATKQAMAAGVKREQLIVDPGIGFGKSVQDNYVIINNIGLFKRLGFPILIGLSRKSLIAALYNSECDRLPATLALNTAAVLNGADIIRIHDIREHRLAMRAIEKLKMEM